MHFSAAAVVSSVLGGLALLSLGLTLWQWLAARRFPLHLRRATPGFAPGLTLLKPLKGCDAFTKDCLRSWFAQKYAGPVQILFGVARADDPVCEIVRELMAEFSSADAKLVVCGPLSGANLKVSKLAQLEMLAKHDLLVVSDADVRAPEDFLANLVAPLARTDPYPPTPHAPGNPSAPSKSRLNPLSPGGMGRGECGEDAVAAIGDPLSPGERGRGEGNVPTAQSAARTQTGTAASGHTIGLVTCFYRLANPSTAAMRWEAVAINADFWSQVLQAQSLKPLDFALGAVMLTRRNALEEIGGFKALMNCLADDYQLGNRLARRGYRLALCPVVVECWSEPMGWRAVWKHQLRWARTIRACQPAPYFFSMLGNATLWPLLFLAFGPARFSIALGAICLAVRITTAADLGRRLGAEDAKKAEDHGEEGSAGFRSGKRREKAQTSLSPEPDQRLLTSSPTRLAGFPGALCILKDLLQAALWAAAFLGNRIEWRGEKLRLRRDGTILRD